MKVAEYRSQTDYLFHRIAGFKSIPTSTPKATVLFEARCIHGLVASLQKAECQRANGYDLAQAKMAVAQALKVFADRGVLDDL